MYGNLRLMVKQARSGIVVAEAGYPPLSVVIASPREHLVTGQISESDPRLGSTANDLAPAASSGHSQCSVLSNGVKVFMLTSPLCAGSSGLLCCPGSAWHIFYLFQAPAPRRHWSTFPVLACLHLLFTWGWAERVASAQISWDS